MSEAAQIDRTPELVAGVREAAEALVAKMNEALDGGVSQALLLPELVAVFRDAGMLPGAGVDAGALAAGIGLAG